jgi:acetoin utilization protein AcuB
MLVKDWMSKDPITITDETSMMKAIHLMKQNRFRRLPVLQEGRLVGIASRVDIAAAFFAAWLPKEDTR